MTNRKTQSRLLVVGILGVGLAVSCGPAPEESAGSGETETLSIGVMPKLVGIDYFNACERGAREAAAEEGRAMKPPVGAAPEAFEAAPAGDDEPGDGER